MPQHFRFLALFRTRVAILHTGLLLTLLHAYSAIKDVPFTQPLKIATEVTSEVKALQLDSLHVTADGIVYVRANARVARLFEHKLALDRTFRPLENRPVSALAIGNGDLFYALDGAILSNGHAGKPYYTSGTNRILRFAVNSSGRILASTSTGVMFTDAEAFRSVAILPSLKVQCIVSIGEEFLVALSHSVQSVSNGQVKELINDNSLPEITSLAANKEKLYIGTTNGLLIVDRNTGKLTEPLLKRLPTLNITALSAAPDGVWAGTTEGVWFRGLDGRIKYFASRRWLEEDLVKDLKMDERGSLWVLGEHSLSHIQFKQMTLRDKADFFDEKVRQRHIRNGFCSELVMRTPGDITSAHTIDSDNDGTWSTYYMASQAFRYAVTGNPEARRHAWETFEAMERLGTMPNLDGFIARSFERRGFKLSDPDRWRPASDPQWDWKGHTSSDEIAAHTFGAAVLWETLARTREERDRVAKFFTRIVDHILKNNLYLIDIDGKPTLWGRWNPEYVNWFPHSIIDRRLNSAEIIASLQLAYAMTGKRDYKSAAEKLFKDHGYLENILSSTKLIADTKGFIHQDNDMGNEWNHSDDLLSFVTYWTLHRFAFTPQLRAKYQSAIRDHWLMEKDEKCPIWSSILGSTGDKDCDLEGAVWTLREFPLDMVNWSIKNSNRKDLTFLPPNFRDRQMAELISPAERQMTRWNGHPFHPDGGDGGRSELAGDEYLLPYWMARYLKQLE